MLPTQTLSHKMSFFINYILCQLKEASNFTAYYPTFVRVPHKASVEGLSFVVPELFLIANSKPISWHLGERNRLFVVKKAEQTIAKMGQV